MMVMAYAIVHTAYQVVNCGFPVYAKQQDIQSGMHSSR